MSEYKAAVENASAGEIVDMDELTQRLTAEHDWTVEGAQAIASLAADYGAFILRNALALAIALGKEDGDLGL